MGESKNYSIQFNNVVSARLSESDNGVYGWQVSYQDIIFRLFL